MRRTCSRRIILGALTKAGGRSWLDEFSGFFEVLVKVESCWRGRGKRRGLVDDLQLRICFIHSTNFHEQLPSFLPKTKPVQCSEYSHEEHSALEFHPSTVLAVAVVLSRDSLSFPGAIIKRLGRTESILEVRYHFKYEEMRQATWNIWRYRGELPASLQRIFEIYVVSQPCT